MKTTPTTQTAVIPAPSAGWLNGGDPVGGVKTPTLPRHCERSEAIHMDCRVRPYGLPRNDDETNNEPSPPKQTERSHAKSKT